MSRSRSTRAVATLTAIALGCGEDPRLLPVAFVGGGTFRASLKCQPGIDRGCEVQLKRGERSRLILWLGPFWADTTLVRSEQFAACQNDGACAWPRDRQDDRWARPADERAFDAGFAYVPFEQAASYCRWRGWRLPTPDEYERMGRWTDGRLYAWGDREAPLRANMRKASPDGIRELNFIDQWVALPGGRAATMGGVHSVPIRAEIEHESGPGVAFRCVYTPPWDPAPGVGRVIEPSGDPWVEGGPDG